MSTTILSFHSPPSSSRIPGESRRYATCSQLQSYTRVRSLFSRPLDRSHSSQTPPTPSSASLRRLSRCLSSCVVSYAPSQALLYLTGRALVAPLRRLLLPAAAISRADSTALQCYNSHTQHATSSSSYHPGRHKVRPVTDIHSSPSLQHGNCMLTIFSLQHAPRPCR